MWGEMRQTNALCVTYSIAPASQQVVGHGVLWLQLNGFIQMILGGEADRQGEDFQCWFMTRLLFHCLLFWPDLSCFTNPQVFSKHLAHTQSHRATRHSCLSHSFPPTVFSILPLSDPFFFYIFPLQLSIFLSFTCQEFVVTQCLGKLLTEDKMLRALVPHSILCNWMAIGVA